MHHYSNDMTNQRQHLFDYVISNPPYQNAKNSAIFQSFQYNSFYFSTTTHMIYPAQKWLLKSGKGVGIDKLFDTIKHKKNMFKLTIYEEPAEVFPTIELAGGLSIVYSDNNNNDYFDYEIIKNSNSTIRKQYYNTLPATLPLHHTLNDIVNKAMKNNTRTLSSIVQKSSLYNINSSFIEKHNKSYNDNVINSNAQEPVKEGYYKVYSNATSGVAGKADWFQVRKELLPQVNNVNTYRIALGTRSTAGAENRSQLAHCYKPNEIFGDLRYCVGVFTTEKEALNFMEWLKTPLIRTLCFSSARRIKNFGVNVPLLDSYNNSQFIDFNKNIEEQLEELYDINQEEKDYINDLMNYFGKFYQE